MLTPDPPLKVVKNAQTVTVATAVPPGTQPNSAWNSRASRSDALPAASIVPARVNSGMVGRIGFDPMR